MTTVETGSPILTELFGAAYDPNAQLALYELSSELQDTSLRPYNDDGFLMTDCAPKAVSYAKTRQLRSLSVKRLKSTMMTRS